ncbi:hypothetical protein JS528_06495 [Bifidobacterium sp. MA2]|uniref:Lipoprotein n=1 Tax=Bifidobacterium santillanense TaxID=2809028 RepID=A0ABS5UPX4_9BIFI|nr:hypothetical protein [Bifidobacterium santillanense]MBT1173010.1 hypothetical protein [Bifidobacterium santillanense]
MNKRNMKSIAAVAMSAAVAVSMGCVIPANANERGDIYQYGNSIVMTESELNELLKHVGNSSLSVANESRSIQDWIQIGSGKKKITWKAGANVAAVAVIIGSTMGVSGAMVSGVMGAYLSSYVSSFTGGTLKWNVRMLSQVGMAPMYEWRWWLYKPNGAYYGNWMYIDQNHMYSLSKNKN